jgi:hypothetical protein
MRDWAAAAGAAAARSRRVTLRLRPGVRLQTPTKCPCDLKNSAALRTYSQS